MYSRVILFGMLMFAFAQVNAQENKWAEADAHSYSYYINHQWHDVINLGDSMRRGGFNSAELQLRMADAYIELGRYTQALQHLRSANRQDASNNYYYRQWSTANKLLFRREDSRYYQSVINTDSSRSFNLINEVNFTGGVKLPSLPQRKNFRFFNAGIGGDFSWRLSWYQSVQSYTQEWYRPNDPSHLDLLVSQTEYYLRVNYKISRDLTLIPALHFISTKDEQVVNAPPPPRNQPPGPSSTIQTHANGRLMYLGLRYKFGSFMSTAYLSYGKLATDNPFQNGLSLTWFPLGHAGLYLNGSAEFIRHSDQRTVFIPGAVLGFYIGKGFWYEADYLYGSLDNYVTTSGEDLFNTTDASLRLLNNKLSWYISKSWSLYASYQYQLKEDRIQRTHYNQNSIITGLSWQIGK